MYYYWEDVSLLFMFPNHEYYYIQDLTYIFDFFLRMTSKFPYAYNLIYNFIILSLLM